MGLESLNGDRRGLYVWTDFTLPFRRRDRGPSAKGPSPHFQGGEQTPASPGAVSQPDPLYVGNRLPITYLEETSPFGLGIRLLSFVTSGLNLSCSYSWIDPLYACAPDDHGYDYRP